MDPIVCGKGTPTTLRNILRKEGGGGRKAKYSLQSSTIAKVYFMRTANMTMGFLFPSSSACANFGENKIKIIQCKSRESPMPICLQGVTQPILQCFRYAKNSHQKGVNRRAEPKTRKGQTRSQKDITEDGSYSPTGGSKSEPVSNGKPNPEAEEIPEFRDDVGLELGLNDLEEDDVRNRLWGLDGEKGNPQTMENATPLRAFALNWNSPETTTKVSRYVPLGSDVHRLPITLRQVASSMIIISFAFARMFACCAHSICSLCCLCCICSCTQ